jgi:hypothetical protein
MMNNHTRNILLALLAITGAALAQQVSQNLSLSINGKNSSDKAVILVGKTYYPESALKALGVSIKRTGSKIALTSKGVAGGTNQMAALEGCLGETLFNGALRVKLHGFEAFQKDGKAVGWTVDLEFRNGTQQVSNLYGFGLSGGSSWYIAYDDASTYPFYIIGSNGVDGGRDIVPGSSYRTKFNFEPDTSNQRDLPFDATRKPVKLLLGFLKSAASSDVQKLLTTDPSFRFRLDCKK